MNLMDILSEAQGGRAMDNLGRQFGLDEQQTKSAVSELVPAISAGLKRNSADREGLGALLGALKTGNHSRYADDPSLLASEQTVAEGNGILGHLFGSREVSRAVAEKAAASSGIASSILKKMLPVIASMVMGVLAKKAMGGALGGTLGRSVGNSIARRSGGMIGRMIVSGIGRILGGGLIMKFIGGFLLKRLFGRYGKKASRNIFGSLLDSDGDGRWADDLLSMATKTLRR